MAKTVKLEKFLEDYQDSLELEQLDPQVSLDRDITSGELNRPGLELVGYWDFFESDRLQIFGNKELAFLTAQSSEDVRGMIDRFFQLDVPCVIFANALEPPDVFGELAGEYGIPVLQSRMTATELMTKLNELLVSLLAPSTTWHGSMVDIYGIGVLFTGRSGIGKSEVALDLVERGHRLVADDVVKIRKEGSQVLIGSGHEILQNHLEVRGVGIVDVRRMFGIRSVRAQKRLEVIVELIEWEEGKSYERIGVEDKFSEILGVEIPYIKLPIFPGKNITVISEVIALNQLLKIYGEFPAKEFRAQLMDKLKEQASLREYLSRDYE